jgi:hypothetical protein
MLKEVVFTKILFNICHCNSGLAFKSKNYYFASQNCEYIFHKRKFSKLTSKMQVSFVNEATAPPIQIPGYTTGEK